MTDGGDEEGDESGHGTADMRTRGRVDVTTEEVVDGDVPLPGELEPVGAVPPVGVEVAVREAFSLVNTMPICRIIRKSYR